MKKWLLLPLFYMVSIFAVEVDGHGYWIGEDLEDQHWHDPQLSLILTKFLLNEQALSVVDFGCGLGQYAKKFIQHGIYTEAYDGNPQTVQLTEGIGKVLDLSVPFDLEKTFDWVISLEVGEHLPKEYEQIFIENLIRHCKKGVVLSWAVKGQEGLGHVNTQDNDYIKGQFESYGLVNDPVTEKMLRTFCSLSWFKKSIMVFRKPS